MDDERMVNALQRAHVEGLRAYILSLLDDCYPERKHSDVIYWQLQKRGLDTCINEVVRELHYLRDKDLVSLECIVADRFLASPTARGRDVAGGAIEETGIMNIALKRY